MDGELGGRYDAFGYWGEARAISFGGKVAGWCMMDGWAEGLKKMREKVVFAQGFVAREAE